MADHEAGSQLKLYMHLGSAPARAVVIFCRANNIEAEEFIVDLTQRETRKPEFKTIDKIRLNVQKSATTHHDSPGLNEEPRNFALLGNDTQCGRSLVSMTDHGYPKDAKKRALVDAALDWHHLNLRNYSVQLLINRTYAKLPQFAGNFPAADYDTLAADAEKRLSRVFDELEFMLQGGKFLQNADTVSIADLSLVCEMMQLQAVCRVEDLQNLLGSHDKITKWMVDVEEALKPHFSDVHQVVRAYGKQIAEVRANRADS